MLQGEAGASGPKGSQGIQGSRGDPGIAGPPGAEGIAGSDGLPGSNGEKGASVSTCLPEICCQIGFWETFKYIDTGKIHTYLGEIFQLLKC